MLGFKDYHITCLSLKHTASSDTCLNAEAISTYFESIEHNALHMAPRSKFNTVTSQIKPQLPHADGLNRQQMQALKLQATQAHFQCLW